ncbi:heavy metal-binding domain-containing protein [Winogradskyella maritima]|uniref:YbjQ family protein n=1 Tax=Winogradskyella maritima TaxID=1517766 RepID=A0ABV8AE64_9FLAO|nr:heavy metal-binding domain-containing protein [Winogradskyella maritima]
MILTTTNSIEGHPIIDYLGIVSGVSMNYQKGAMTFNMKKFYSALSDEVKVLKEQAFQELKQHASELKANAVVGISVDVEISTSGSITASVTGTAVKVQV